MATSAFVGTDLPKSRYESTPGAEAGAVGSLPFAWDWLAPLRLAETLPIAHEPLPSIQLRPLPMIERFG
jgi:hypothetical protein